MLVIDNLSSGYGTTTVLHGVSLDVPAGAIVSVVGANGAGKSTLLNTLSGLIKVRGGSFALEGRQLSGLGAERIVRHGITLVPERRQLFGTMSVEENLLLGAHSRHHSAETVRDIDVQFELFPVLKERRHQLASSLSGGEQQMLAIARARMSRPKLIMMDEPSLGLAPLLVHKVFKLIAQLRDTGTTILLVEQNAQAALTISDFAHVMETGRVRISGAAMELLTDPRVREMYLGGEHEGPDGLEARIRRKAALALSGAPTVGENHADD